jgi:2-phosphoglycerate kinase
MTTEAAPRLGRWRKLEEQGRPLLVLIGGATGVGKSTIATELGRTLGITRVSSTDFIRQVLRSVVPDAIAPELSHSTFELDRERSNNGATPHAEFERQARDVLVGVRATIERAAHEGTSIILEGIHLLPGLVDLPDEAGSLVVQVVLTVADGNDHERRFALRARESHRPAERYDDGLEAIRDLQAYFVDKARRAGVPLIENRDEEATVQRVLDLVLTAVDDALLPRPESARR